MKLLFYFMHKVVRDNFGYVEREATPDLLGNGALKGYYFDKIEGYGRPFEFIKVAGIGGVFERDYMYVLVVKEEDRGKVASLWDAYFDEEINKAEALVTELKGKKISAENSEVFSDKGCCK